jgi:hypothetical protein
MTLDASEKTQPSSLNRRAFIKNTGRALSGGLCTHLHAHPIKPLVYGQGDFRYEQVPGWGQLDPEVTPVSNCHGLAHTRDGHIVLLTDHTKNSVIVYDRAGKLQHKWGTQFPQAHGLTLQEEQGREVLYITDLASHAVYKTSLDGEILQQWDAPLETPNGRNFAAA